MIQNKLKINNSKTEFLVLTSSSLKQHFNDLNISVDNSRVAPSISARKFGVKFDNHMSLDKQINCICTVGAKEILTLLIRRKKITAKQGIKFHIPLALLSVSRV